MSLNLSLFPVDPPLKRKKKARKKVVRTKKPGDRYRVAFEKNGVVLFRDFKSLERAQEFRYFIKVQPEVNQVSGIKVL
jgi:hypothetical protein